MGQDFLVQKKQKRIKIQNQDKRLVRKTKTPYINNENDKSNIFPSWFSHTIYVPGFHQNGFINAHYNLSK